MEHRPLGQSGLSTEPLIFGGNVFGWTLDESQSFEILDAWLDAGFHGIDTADVYSRWAEGHAGGESEAVLGRWFKARGNRDKVLLTTKVGMDMGHGGGLSKRRIVSAVEASLRRLRTDYIDLYLSHRDDETVPLEETLGAYQQLLDQGKVRAIGASNHSAGRLARALRADGPRYQVLQPFYNLYDRAVYEDELMPLCRDEGLGVTPYFSLASGFLTGKYRRAEDARGRARQGFVEKYFNPRGERILDALERVAERLDASPAAVALAWLMARPTITAPIASATSVAQLDQLVAATRIELDDEALEILNRASAGDENGA